ncbi:MAG: hypothetical protein PHC75_08920 [Burkholderiales bacterium]|nr:hypothetical protein [Burkholderiales bacterium]
MGTLVMKHFDVLDFVKKSKELGVDERVAELQARQFEQAIDIAVSNIENRDLVNKHDLEKTRIALKADIDTVKLELSNKLNIEIGSVRNEIEKTKVWVLLLLGGGWLSLVGMMAKGFHWF